MKGPLDVWKVDASELTLHVDPEDEVEAVYSLSPISPSRLSFLGTYMDGEPVR